MLLTITTEHRPATDLGYLLAKHPGRAQSFNLAFGKAHVFYPEVSEERCTAALLVDMDPLGLVRAARRQNTDDGLLTHYVNDRPYVPSSLLSVALSRVFGTAMAGNSRERQELADAALALGRVSGRTLRVRSSLHANWACGRGSRRAATQMAVFSR